ncbi:E4 SUMO-protein ligase PIAL2 isoform X2 [Diospyros lotus]|uniref:E4 SUMO-protein ligase PIAL2 isoform X2 n=1 Tax=Diospyros lotus TaxID=55363 RepID=UPI0022562750|nr:E4 SUMO-protein ligase PIAL2 isoform X2 [Diospyros lotus]
MSETLTLKQAILFNLCQQLCQDSIHKLKWARYLRPLKSSLAMGHFLLISIFRKNQKFLGKRKFFLLNGNGVDKRIAVFPDPGPQLPTPVTHMLKYGTNLLQAVGLSNGNYIIVVAFTSEISRPDHHVLPDYVQPAVAPLDSDDDIIEGPSRISLNCPISFRRIKTPVKGHSCKHPQCFDFDNFLDINSRRPSWRCPHCNQSVSYVDIRIDQNMVKVLKEVGENVVDIIISADGSWEAVAENTDNDQPYDKMLNGQQDRPVKQSDTDMSDARPDILDLTEGNDEMDVLATEMQDQKPVLSNVQLSSVGNVTAPPGMNNATEINQNAAPIPDEFWSGLYLSTYGSGAPGARFDAQIAGAVPGSFSTNFMMSPVLTDAVSPTFNRESEVMHGSALLPNSMPQSQLSAPSNLQLQQSQFGNSVAGNEYGRGPSMPRHVSRTSVAVQALPAQSLTSVSQQRSNNSFNNLTPQGPSLASQTSSVSPIADGFNTISSTMERQQQFPISHFIPRQASQLTSSSLQQHSATQPNWVSSQAAQRVAGLQAPSLPSAYRVSSASTEQQNSRHLQPVSLRVPHCMNQSSGLVHSSVQLPTPFMRNQIPQVGTQSGVGQTAVSANSPQLVVSSQRVTLRAAQMARQSSPSVPVPLQTTRASSSFPVNADRFRPSPGDLRGNIAGSLQQTAGIDGSPDLPSEQNWRPTGRMRGSLSGRAYSAALSQFIIQPTQTVQTARPPINMASTTAMEVLLANNRNAHAPDTTNLAGSLGGLPTNMAGSSGGLPSNLAGNSGVHRSGHEMQ